MPTLPDFSPGPLDFYRKKACFDWKKMKYFLDTEEGVQFEKDLCERLQSHPEFQEDLYSEELDQQRHISFRRNLYNMRNDILSENQFFENFPLANISTRLMLQLCPSSAFRFATGALFTGVLKSQGMEQHQEVSEQAEKGKLVGSFCMTEFGHGSNINGIQTTATYDKDKQEFVLHTPNFEAAKCWAGCLGKCASYAIVYAQLYMDGNNYGLHMFLVPVRDPKTLLPYPGIIVGDMGEKIGLNGMDNGFLFLNHYRIPRKNLLNKSTDITPEGKYVTTIKSSKERNGATLGVVSIGRSKVTLACETTAGKALTIAIRYAAVRKQFGPGKEEIPILEYQSLQFRLLPYLAAAYMARIFGLFLVEKTYKFVWDLFMGERKNMDALGREIHVLSSAAKPVVGWMLRDAIQECREVCGGHGYLKAAGIGNIRNDNDSNMTFEGENHVIIQQTSNWLVKLWPEIANGNNVSSPLHSVDFLSTASQILKSRFKATNIEEVSRPESITNAFHWIVCYLLKETTSKYNTLLDNNENKFWARNDTQIFYAKSLSVAFIQNFFLEQMWVKINEAEDVPIRFVLSKLYSLYGLWSLEKFLATLYEGGYAQGPQPSRLIHEAILKLCSDIKNDSVSLIDAIAPPDFTLGSVLGHSDGQVYKRLEFELLRTPYCMTRPKWWKEVVHWKFQNMKNKL